MDAGMNGTTTATVRTREDLRRLVADELDLSPEQIANDDDLLGRGMHSLAMMKFAGRLRKAGHRINYSKLALTPTIDEWAQLLDLGSETAEPAGVAPAAAEDAGDDGAEFALATMQHAYWIGRDAGQALGGVAAHLYVEFDGAGIDPERLRDAVRRLTERHEMLRVRIGDNGTQSIGDTAYPNTFTLIDLRRGADPETALADLRDRKSHQRMDIENGQVLDVTVTLLPDGRHRLHVDVDMIAADAQSYRRLLADLADAYVTEADLPEIGYSYRRYLADRAVSLDAAAADEDRLWWAERLDTLPEIPALPTVPEHERTDPNRSVRLHHLLTPERKRRLESAATAASTTPAAVVASLFAEAIAVRSASQRFLLNVPLFNREPLHSNVDDLVGDFTNSVLVDVDLTARRSIRDRAQAVQRAIHTASAHSAREGLDVLRDLGRHLGRPVTPSVVFTSGLNLGELFSERVTEVFGRPAWVISQGPQVDLDAQVAEVDGGILVNWDIRRDAFPAGVVEAMFGDFVRLIDGALADDADWDRLPAEADIPRPALNATDAAPAPRTLHDSFFERADRHPDAPAVLGVETVSFGELSRAARSVSAALRAVGVQDGDAVAVSLSRGSGQITAVLGVLAAGAHYVPIGVHQPAVRRDTILRAAGARVLIGESESDAPEGVRVLPIAEAITAEPLGAPVPVAPEAVAYVLFTSGSTGEPKGVEVSHRAAAATIDAIADRFDLTDRDRTIGLSALEFDLSVFDIFAPLALGGAVVTVADQIARDARAWSELIAATGVTVVNAAPGLIGMLAHSATPEELGAVRLVLTGGDRVDADLARRLRAAVPGLRFVGLGGATETAIHSTVHEVTDATDAALTQVPYGRPLAGVALRVVNERGEDCPDLVAGEIWIGGAGVADGYRGDPDRTADRFVIRDGIRWYRTGDLGRVLPGEIVDFIGRRDHQVKIRGYRVELGEVEAALQADDAVEAAVAAVIGTGSPRLLAAVAGDGVDAERLLKSVRDRLPDYMVPESVEVLDRMPITRNGKLDRAEVTRLLEAGAGTESAFEPPADAVEAALAYLVAQLLEVDRVGVESDFFQIGGNSITATLVIAKVRGLLLVRNVGFADLFDTRTVRSFATLLGERTDPVRLTRVARMFLEVAGIEEPLDR
ncbi:non-ribosomal peptide synthetase [Millisia brevis]|uniref:non-ribosomal peptide synthetase n=1 Tax=Millisia brevis TaxID=264148 RepID=UPI000A02E496|nr:non-ribosomal peptide synthetase [Millisia brevis]